jgi:hypothetical protein
VTAFSIHNAVCPEAGIVRHDAEVYARGAAGPMTDISNLVCAGFRRWRRGVPRAIGRSADNQIDPGASPLRNIRRNVVETLRGNGIVRILSGPISRLGLYPWGMTSGAGIVISSSLGPAVEFSGSEFDAKVGRECRPDPAGDR